MTDQCKQNMADTKFVVEANACETQMLWEKYCTQSMFKTELTVWHWEQLNTGYRETIGQCGGFPVCVSFFWHRINGVLVMFYDATSRVVDHQMVEDWLDKNCCPRYDRSSREARCDANNFHLVLDYIKNPQ